MLYLVLDSPNKIRDIRRWVADCQNPAIKTCDYIPPLFFYRYSALSKHASEMRQENKELKTQIRFVDQDIVLFTKEKGTDNPFKMADMSEIEKHVRLPPPDHSVSWKQKPEKQQWRRTSPYNKEIVLKSLSGSKARATTPPSPPSNPPKDTEQHWDCAEKKDT